MLQKQRNSNIMKTIRLIYIGLTLTRATRRRIIQGK